MVGRGKDIQVRRGGQLIFLGSSENIPLWRSRTGDRMERGQRKYPEENRKRYG